MLPGLGHGLVRGGGAAASGAPAYAISFLNNALPQGVTFSRASTAQYYNQSGLLSTNENLFLQSNFSTGWAFSASASFVGTGTAPDGTNTAQLFNDATAASSTYVYQSINWTSGTVYTIKIGRAHV